MDKDLVRTSSMNETTILITLVILTLIWLKLVINNENN